MSDSLREQILAAIVLRLQTMGTVPKENVFRSRVVPVTRDLSPAIVIRPVDETVEQMIDGRAQRLMGVEVHCIMRGAEGDRLLDPILTELLPILTPGVDISLGGLAVAISEKDTKWEYADADQDATIAMVTFEVKYRTLWNDITQKQQ